MLVLWFNKVVINPLIDKMLLRHDWDILLPPIVKPPIVSKEPGVNNKSGKKLKILHLSDTHWDPYYKV